MNTLNSMNSFSRGATSGGNPGNHLLYDPIISYAFRTTDVQSGLVLNHADNNYDLTFNGSIVRETVGTPPRTVNAFKASNGLRKNSGGHNAQVADSTKFIRGNTTYSAITFSYWMYITSHTEGQNTTMIMWSRSGSDTNGLLLAGIGAGNTIIRKGKINMGGVGDTQSTTEIFAINTWYHVAIVVQGGGGTSGSANMYLNGSNSPVITQTGNIVINIDRTNPLCLGSNGNFVWDDETLKAYIANFRVYGNALPSIQREDIYTKGIID
jgi:hypothetical protein